MITTCTQQQDCFVNMREPFNGGDPFIVAVMKEHTIVGHVPKIMSSICSLFLTKKDTITCRVTMNSEDLLQGVIKVT